ncbi:MAG: 5'-3' exonuclease H3TH domain-containing protein [Candidatus Gracilibacteria bacterium]|nr:5'-3' exonuclease H3TH domain-containing protein [Candidatus Gracilibacteria bacterium]
MSKKIYLVDGNNFIYRMFFALPEFSTKDGKIVNAVFGMAKFFVGQLINENPDYLIFIRDAKGKNFRHDLYADYKATRDKMPDNLRAQIGDIEHMITLMGVPIVEIDGCEADDVIGTLVSKLGNNRDYEIDILTGDKDLYSLVSKNVKIYDTMKKQKFGPEETREKYGIDSGMIIDYLAIIGDKSDNIPGIEGFGPKKAVDLINYIGGVEDIFETVDKIEAGKLIVDDLDKSVQSVFKGKTYERLLSSKDVAFISKKLATIACDIEIKDFNLNNFAFHPEKIFNDDVKDYFRSLEFNSLLNEETKKLSKWDDLGLKVNIIGDKQGLDELEKTISKYDEVVFDTETTSLNIIEAELVGLSIYLDDKHIYYINRLHKGPQVDDVNFIKFVENFIKMDKILIAHNLKYDLEILSMFISKGVKNHESVHSTGGGQMSLGV